MKRQLVELNRVCGAEVKREQGDGNNLFSQQHGQPMPKHQRFGSGDSGTDSGLGSSLLGNSYQQLSFNAQNSFTFTSPKIESDPWSGQSMVKSSPSNSFKHLQSPVIVRRNDDDIFSSPKCVSTTNTSFPSTGTSLWPSFQTNFHSGTNGQGLSLSKPIDAAEYRFDGRSLSCLNSGVLVRMGSPETAPLTTPKCERRLINRCQSENYLSPDLHTPTARPISSQPGLRSQSDQQNITPHAASSLSYFGAFSLSTSTPVRNDQQCTSVAVQSQFIGSSATTTCSSNLNCIVVPSSPRLKQSVSSVPRTPTPFKKAMAAIERRQGRIERSITPDAQAAQDLKEIIQKDHVSFCAMSSPVHRNNQSDTTLNFNITPSKLVHDSSFDFSPPSLMKNYRSNDCAETILMDSQTRSWENNDIPDRTPERLSSKWFQITCGQTRNQQELTMQAKQFLGMS